MVEGIQFGLLGEHNDLIIIISIMSTIISISSDTDLGIIIIIIRIVDGMQFGSAATHSDSDLGRVDLSLASHNIGWASE